MSASPSAPILLEGWQVSTGIDGSFQAESVATFAWNRWQVSTGISGNLRPEYATTRSKTSVRPWAAQKAGSTSGATATRLTIHTGPKSAPEDQGPPRPKHPKPSNRPSCPCGVRFAKTDKVVVLRPSSRGSHSTV